MNETDILHDFHNYGASIKSREMFLHNYYYTAEEDNPGVEYKMSTTFLKNLRVLESKSSDPITIHMQSVGGQWSDGMVIYDAISMCNSYVTIIAYGQAESMSSIILQAADYRCLSKHSYFMCHFGSTSVDGGYLDVQNWINYEKYICDIMLDIYAKRCVSGKYFKDKYGSKSTSGKVKNFLVTKFKSGDWYMNPEEAVHYGFADKVVDSWI